MDEKKIDSFDDLFEPFDLDPPDEDSVLPPPVQRSVASVPCPSCGSQNPEHNRHCEDCGARLDPSPLPVAPPPMVRNTPGSRALGVLAGIVLVVAMFAFIWNLVRGDDAPDESADPVETTTTSAPTQAFEVTQLIPTSIEASSQLRGYEATGLIDNDPDTEWNDASARGTDAWLKFRFSQPVQIAEIEIQNLSDEERFRRNYRIEGYEIVIDDLAIPVQGILDDTREVQTIRIASVETSELTLFVKSVYPAESFNDQIPFDELAVSEVRFFGRTVSN